MIILLNGPSHSGKDTLARKLFIKTNWRIESFALPLKKVLSELFLISIEELERNKDEVFFNQKTGREMLISLSEDWVKKVLGRNFWALHLAKRLKFDYKDRLPIVIITDCGFEEEFWELQRQFPNEKILLLRLRRNGKNFSNDSRNYLRDGLCKTMDLFVKESEEGFDPEALETLFRFIKNEIS